MHRLSASGRDGFGASALEIVIRFWSCCPEATARDCIGAAALRIDMRLGIAGPQQLSMIALEMPPSDLRLLFWKMLPHRVKVRLRWRRRAQDSFL